MRKKCTYNIRHTYNSCLCNSPSKLEYNPVKWQMPAVQTTHFSFSLLLTTFWKNQTRAKEKSDFHSTQARREMLRLGPNCIRLTAPLVSTSRLNWAVAMEKHGGLSPHWTHGESCCWRAKWKSRRCQSQYFFLLFPPLLHFHFVSVSADLGFCRRSRRSFGFTRRCKPALSAEASQPCKSTAKRAACVGDYSLFKQWAGV